MSKLAEKVPGWVERLLIPALESRVRTIVKDETSHLDRVIGGRFEALEKVMDARFEALDAKVGSVDKRVDSLDKKIPLLQDMAEIKARLTLVEKSQSKS
jgi:hypothetical protein